mmetsp:Transcript_4689/g.10569  ORF Transcript_4689/g.10569 Transcript_4689/m.10569 type:complete len:99 (-) Transcript_4689:431-727(-)
MEVVQPETVFVELDPKRAARLRATASNQQWDVDPLEQAFQNAANQIAKARGGELPNPLRRRDLAEGKAREDLGMMRTFFEIPSSHSMMCSGLRLFTWG